MLERAAAGRASQSTPLASKHYAVVASFGDDDGVQIIDITDPSSPSLLRQQSTDGDTVSDYPYD